MEVAVLFKQLHSKIRFKVSRPVPFYNPEWALCSLACRKETRWLTGWNQVGCCCLPFCILFLIYQCIVFFFLMSSWCTPAKHFLFCLLCLSSTPRYHRRASGKRCRGVPSWPHYGRIKVEGSATFWSEKRHFHHLWISASAFWSPRLTPLSPSRADHQPRSMNFFFFLFFEEIKSRGSCHDTSQNTRRLAPNPATLRCESAGGQTWSRSTFSGRWPGKIKARN